MAKIISTLGLIVMLFLLPLAGIITLTQGSNPGDMTYPVKRSLESTALFLASFNSTTAAYFSSAQANRRYDETAALLSKGVNAEDSLLELVSQTNVAKNDINKVGNAHQRARLIANLSASIEKYDKGLEQAQVQISRRSRSISSPVPIATAQPIPNAPVVIQDTQSAGDEEARRQQEAIEKARRELEELKRRLEEEQKSNAKKEDTQPAPQSPSPGPSAKAAAALTTPTPTPTPTPVAIASPSPSAQMMGAAGAAPTPAPSVVSCTTSSAKSSTVDSKTQITWTYLFEGSTLITKVSLKATPGVAWKVGNTQGETGASLDLNLPGGVNPFVFSAITSQACQTFTGSLVLTNNCNSPISSFVGVNSAASWGQVCR